LLQKIKEEEGKRKILETERNFQEMENLHSIEEKSSKAYSMLEEGSQLLKQNEFDRAIGMYERAEFIFKELNSFSELKKIQESITNIKIEKKRFLEKTEKERLLKERKEKEKKKELELFKKIKEEENKRKAAERKRLNLALESAKNEEETNKAAYQYLEMGSDLIKQKDYSSGIEYYEQALEIFKKFNFQTEIARTNEALANLRKEHLHYMARLEQEEIEKEILEAVSEGEREGYIKQEDRSMIASILDFKDQDVSSAMTPRTEMVSIPDTAKLEQAIEVVRDRGHSRIPVHKGNRDSIVGVIYAKDILFAMANGDAREKPVTEIMRKPFFVPETKKLTTLLREFQNGTQHIAIVLDEYGALLLGHCSCTAHLIVCDLV